MALRVLARMRSEAYGSGVFMCRIVYIEGRAVKPRSVPKATRLAHSCYSSQLGGGSQRHISERSIMGVTAFTPTAQTPALGAGARQVVTSAQVEAERGSRCEG